MRTFAWSVVAIGLLAAQLYSASPGQRSAAQTDEALRSYRGDLQAERADVMAKNLTLSAVQAAAFWPEYQKFQAEQATIVDGQLAAIEAYVAGYATLDDAGAMAHINSLLDRDQRMHDLRTKWLAEFQKILPARTAARVIQIDRRLGLAHQMFISSQLPLIN